MRCRPTSAICASPPRCCAPSRIWTAISRGKSWRALRPSSPCPSCRFYTAIEQLSGKDGEKAGGFRKYGKHYVKCAQGDTGALEVIADSGTVSGAQIKAADVTPVADPAYKPAAGDYVKAVAGAEINFMILHAPALIQFQKHVAPKIVSPEQNQTGDAWKYGTATSASRTSTQISSPVCSAIIRPPASEKGDHHGQIDR